MPLISAQGSSLVPATRSSGELRGNVADPADHRFAREAKRTFFVPALLAGGNKLRSRIDGLGQVGDKIVEAASASAHRSTASLRIGS